MKRCKQCGVEIEDHYDRCPLCGASPEGDVTDATSEAAGGAESVIAMDLVERRKARFWLWEMFTVVIFASAVIVAAADFAYGFAFSWSAYPLISLAFIWLFLTAIIALGRNLAPAYVAATLDLLLYLFFLDILTPGEPWFLPLALPCTLLVAVVGGGAAGIARGLKLSVFQTLADAVLSMGVLLLGLEIILSVALDLESILSWSIVSFAGCLSIAVLLLIINKRLREHHADFKRVFHL